MNISELETIDASIAKGHSAFLIENDIDPSAADVRINPYYVDENGVRVIPVVLWVDGEPVAAGVVSENEASFQNLLDATGQIVE